LIKLIIFKPHFSFLKNAEEKKIQETEFCHVLMSRKEKCMKVEAGIERFESEVDKNTKRMINIQSKIEQRSISLKQVLIVL